MPGRLTVGQQALNLLIVVRIHAGQHFGQLSASQPSLLPEVRSYLTSEVRSLCILPPLELQKQFSMIVLATESLKQKMQIQPKELNNQFQALIQKSFSNN